MAGLLLFRKLRLTIFSLVVIVAGKLVNAAETMKTIPLLFLVLSAQALNVFGGVTFYGDQDVLGTGTYASDPTVGATLQGLSAGTVTYATLITPHNYPFAPGASDFAGTDQIYVGQTQTGFHDGYSTSAGRTNGPQILNLDYSGLLSPGDAIGTFTLGIAADDFQNVPFGQPFTAFINGVANTSLTTALNGFDQSGPVVQFFTIGIDPALLDGTGVLKLTINQGGDGGDGWAVDYLSIGITTVPEPSSFALFSTGMLFALFRRKRTARMRVR